MAFSARPAKDINFLLKRLYYQKKNKLFPIPKADTNAYSLQF